MTVATFAALSVWIPIAGLVWLARRAERQNQERLLHESIAHLERLRIMRGGRV